MVFLAQCLGEGGDLIYCDLFKCTLDIYFYKCIIILSHDYVFKTEFTY